MNELYVDTPQQLATLCQELRKSHFVAVDTEFLREKTYYAQLCLIQVATPTITACIDPLALETLDPLLEVLYDERMLKVLHSARQDLEILFESGMPAASVLGKSRSGGDNSTVGCSNADGRCATHHHVAVAAVAAERGLAGLDAAWILVALRAARVSIQNRHVDGVIEDVAF